ncbi:MAG: hypothetical protein RRB13_03850 [bacterium]|nr:hypothetical protein [bacterium]
MTGNPFDMLDQVVITYSLKYLPCSKEDCLTCLTAKGHGPYWYAHFTLGGEAKDIFLGRSFKPMDLTKILMSDLLNGKRMTQVDQEEQARAYEEGQAHCHLDEGIEDISGNTATATEVQMEAEEQVQAAPAQPEGPRIDRVGPVPRRPLTKKRAAPVTQPPSLADFEQDLRMLEGAAKSENFKLVYRKLIKKYHPDQYASDSRLNQWMSQINGTYNRLRSR